METRIRVWHLPLGPVDPVQGKIGQARARVTIHRQDYRIRPRLTVAVELVAFLGMQGTEAEAKRLVWKPVAQPLGEPVDIVPSPAVIGQYAGDERQRFKQLLL
jgi:hypothetical protein